MALAFAQMQKYSYAEALKFRAVHKEKPFHRMEFTMCLTPTPRKLVAKIDGIWVNFWCFDARKVWI